MGKGRKEKKGKERGGGGEKGEGKKYAAKRCRMYARPVGQMMGPLEGCSRRRG